MKNKIYCINTCPVGLGSRIHRQLLCRGVSPPDVWPEYVTKQSDGKASVMLGLWGMRSTPLFPLLPGSLWPGMVAPDKALSILKAFDAIHTERERERERATTPSLWSTQGDPGSHNDAL